jgi:hypothetical protein
VVAGGQQGFAHALGNDVLGSRDANAPDGIDTARRIAMNRAYRVEFSRPSP